MRWLWCDDYMETKIRSTTTPEYRHLVCRLYGDVLGDRLARRYDMLLSQRQLWRQRLSIQTICVYEIGQLVGHLIVQQPLSGQPPFFGFMESIKDSQVAKTLIETGLAVLSPEQRTGLLAPVDLSFWHAHRFTVSDHPLLSFHEPQQPYYQALFGSFFQQQLTYHTYRWNFPSALKPPVVPPGVSLREIHAESISNDWRSLYDITREAFPSLASAPSFEEFQELFAGDLVAPNQILVAEHENQIIGYCFFRIQGQTLTAKTLAIRQQWQGKRIGRLLYGTAVWQAAQRGCTHVLLLFLRSDRLIEQLRPADSIAISTSILYHTPHL